MKTFLRTLVFLTVLARFVCAEPVSLHEAETAVETFLSLRYPATDQAVKRTVTPVGASSLALTKIEPWVDSGKTIGFVAELQPTGFVLMRADTLCPPTKLYYNKGKFFDLPPDFIEVMEWELKQELQCISDTATKKKPLNSQFETDWSSLLNPVSNDSALREFSETATKAGPLLSTLWNQNSPYNYYAPAASGGPGGRALAGCVATAMAQIMRHHKSPTAIAGDYTYTDVWGSCQGTHSASDAGLGDYKWSDMPNSITDASSTSQKQAIGQLLYHAGVTVDMNFEANVSLAYIDPVPVALKSYFDYFSGDSQNRSSYSDSEWYSKLNTDINNSRPVFYAFFNSADNGHAVVCDGTRNDNEIHINFGWSGTDNAWYNMNSVGDWNYKHKAIFEINPSGGGGGTFTVHKLKGSINWKSTPCTGKDTLIGAIPTTLTDLSFLKGCGNLTDFFTINSGAGNVTGSAGAFKRINKKGTRVTLELRSIQTKYRVSTKLKLKNNVLYIRRKMKNGANSDKKFNIGNADSNWTTKDVTVNLDLSYGGTSIQGAGTKTITYKTKADKKTKIK